MTVAAANPTINATVTASAGSGKTWMLITRIVRILLEGADPGGILALTFTRKAAGEMQQRLAERLFLLATVDDQALEQQLDELGLVANEDYRQRARALYEMHQYCDFPVRTQTFHSFCQDILARFPLEADVPPNFDLLESSALLIKQARDALFNQAALNMQGTVAQDLEALMEACDGQFNLEKSLNSFLAHRSDWWAYTEHVKNPVSFATEALQQHLAINTEEDPFSTFFTETNIDDIKTFARLLALNPTATNIKTADTIAGYLVDLNKSEQAFCDLSLCFLTKDNKPRARKDSKKLRDKLQQEADHFLELAETLPARFLDTLDQHHKLKTFELNRLWYICGEYYITHYQKLKRELRLLDFTDLEWKSYQLLQSSENALWIQYKLDRRIDHLLIDEFQDTNPTQWQLILPLLEEMAASDDERTRSIFLVGDEKQSIYSFRRAKPELQAQASHWLTEHLQAQAYPLNKSWRSSPAIIRSVNDIFTQNQFQSLLPGFISHDTHRSNLPGKVEVFPLFTADKDSHEKGSATDLVLRDPLEQPRTERPSIYLQEGKLIADTIQQLINDQVTIGEGNDAHAINYSDIFILVRKRSHLEDYEQALRQTGIPYLGANKGTLLDCIEIQDMEALLDSLLTPFNNLALAQVLKSPLFNASDNDLMLIAKHKQQHLWIDRMAELSETLENPHPIHRAHRLINQWRSLVDRIPVHDLLDKIYNESNILHRYVSSVPDSLKPRVQANLTRFLELALELDSGRYPSLMHFLHYIRSLKSLSTDAPDEAPMESSDARVTIMTIHASKGLEAPVVFLADTVSINKDRTSISTLVDWPVEETKPTFFQLIPSKTGRDSFSEKLVDKQKYIQQKEEANLLYVAVTRAKQYLYVTGCQPEKGPYSDWHTPIKTALQTLTQDNDSEHLCYQWGDISSSERTTVSSNEHDIKLDRRLFEPFVSTNTAKPMIAPSKIPHDYDNTLSMNNEQDEDAQTRGIAIHRCLDLFSRQPAFSADNVKQLLSTELKLSIDDALIQQTMTEAQNIISSPELSKLFSLDQGTKAFNECPIHYKDNDHMVYGIIDRLLISDHEAYIIDYKSHQHNDPATLENIAQQYTQQMLLYAKGVARAWPDKKIKSALLFTYSGYLHEISLA